MRRIRLGPYTNLCRRRDGGNTDEDAAAYRKQVLAHTIYGRMRLSYTDRICPETTPAINRM